MQRKYNFKTKNNLFEKSRNAKNGAGGPFGFFENPICCKIVKNGGGVLERFKMFEKKCHREILGQVRDLNSRPSASQTSKIPE